TEHVDVARRLANRPHSHSSQTKDHLHCDAISSVKPTSSRIAPARHRTSPTFGGLRSAHCLPARVRASPRSFLVCKTLDESDARTHRTPKGLRPKSTCPISSRRKSRTLVESMWRFWWSRCFSH